MLFLIISSPHPSRPSDVKRARSKFREWIEGLRSQGKVLFFYPIVGRGSAVGLDVSSNDELHELMTQWSDIIPVSFDIYPLTKSV